MKTLLISIISLFIYTTTSQFILPPSQSLSQSSDNHYALLIVPAEQIDPNNYKLLAEQLQSQSSQPLWVGVASLFFDLPNQFTIGPAMRGLFSEMVKKGMKLQSTTIFAAGHSAGGSYLSEYLHDETSNDHLIEKIKGMILIGAYIKRVYYNSHFHLPVLTIQGDLDGVTRISRVAQSMYHFVKDQNDLNHNPYVVIHGVNHGQIATGKMPHYIASRDFQSGINDDSAREQMSEAISEFMFAHVDQNKMNSIFKKALRSMNMLTPIVDALKLEGNYHLKPPCYEAKEDEDCWEESPWTRDVANKVMAGLGSNYQLNNKDILWPAARVLPHDYLPVVQGKCTDQTTTCKLNITSVTENIYEKKDRMDTSQSGVSAFEMRAKIAARQKFWEAAGIDGASDFTKTDGGNLCADINQKAIDWAEENADPTILKRYKSQGQQMVIGEDEGPYNEGPLWIWIDLDYKEEQVSNGGKEMVVKSPMMKTPTNYWIWLSAGFHFCKLLSPARVMEWIYYDSLKASMVSMIDE